MSELAFIRKTGILVTGDEIITPALSTAIVISRFAPTVEAAPVGAGLVLRVQAVTGAAAPDYIVQTIAAGTLYTAAASGALAVGAGVNVIVRVQSAPAGANAPSYLGGYFEFSPSTTPPGAYETLCSLAELKSFEEITTSAYDADLTRLLFAVTAAFETYCGRRLVGFVHGVTIYDDTRDRLSCPTPDDYVQLRDWPVTNVDSVEIDGAVVDPSEYVVIADRGQLYFVGGVPIGCEHILVSYTSTTILPSPVGYPADLVLAALNQCRYQWRLHKTGGDRLAVSTVSAPSGGSAGLITSEWAPTVQATLNRYRRLVV